MPCPMCRSEFLIPKNGVAGLPSRTCSKKQFNAPQLQLGTGGYCEKHDDERIKLYCFDCDVNMCAMCCLQYHKTHQFDRIDEIAQHFLSSVDEEIEQVTSRIGVFRGVIAQLDSENNKALEKLEAMELEVKQRSEEIKEIVDRQESELLQEFQLLKSATEEEIKSQKDTFQLAVAEMENFRECLSELRSKGSPSDITQPANDVHERAKELLETYVIPSEYHAPNYKFTPVNIDELLGDDQNFIGHVVEVGDLGNKHQVLLSRCFKRFLDTGNT